MSNLVLLSEEGPVARITINRPEKRNALSGEVLNALLNVLEKIQAQDAIRTVILTGAGSAFSAGADLQSLQNLQSATTTENLDDSRLLARLLKTLYTFPKPVIARVNGHAIAGGAGLVAACDFAVSTHQARFGFTEVRIGLVPAVIMPFVLRCVRGRDARSLFLRGGLISAADAFDIGLINQVVDEAALDDTVNALAAELSTMTSSSAIALTKTMLAHVPGLSLDEALEYGSHMNALARESEDCKAGVDAFLNKQPMPWNKPE